MLAEAGEHVGQGWGFGIHEAGQLHNVTNERDQPIAADAICKPTRRLLGSGAEIATLVLHKQREIRRSGADARQPTIALRGRQ